ncbi:CLUMA_CG020549, isoform A [Clunio marinus]|uniref:CLUMA_CG020549, isoform A n=1 Tax=Clunio marinus TaxID=568069 RepID=A0A1J1J5A5_9DIPT|nr:CLUMA_CG020549, isoform A [Clunio marinus]
MNETQLSTTGNEKASCKSKYLDYLKLKNKSESRKSSVRPSPCQAQLEFGTVTYWQKCQNDCAWKSAQHVYVDGAKQQTTYKQSNRDTILQAKPRWEAKNIECIQTHTKNRNKYSQNVTKIQEKKEANNKNAILHHSSMLLADAFQHYREML